MDCRRIRRNMALLGVVLAPVACVQAGSLQVIAMYGDPAPGGGGTFRVFGQLDGVDPGISGENIVFAGGVPGVGFGIFAYIDGEFELIATYENPPLDELLDWSTEEYRHNLRGSAMRRAKLDMLQRNAEIARCNAGSRESDAPEPPAT